MRLASFSIVFGEHLTLSAGDGSLQQGGYVCVHSGTSIGGGGTLGAVSGGCPASGRRGSRRRGDLR